jgi:predicted P-loop ATPase
VFVRRGGEWRAEYNRTFAGANVVILPDNDQPGRDHAADVAKHLRRVANSVRVVMLPGLEPKGDVADWIDAGGTREAMEALLPAAAICEPLVEFGLPSPEPHQWDDEPSAEWLDPNGPAPDFDDRLIEIADAPSSEKSHADKPWTEYLQRGDDGEPINNLANVATALRSAPGLKGCFRFDEMKRVAVLTLPLPKGNPGILPRPVRDTDVSITQEHIQRNELRRAGADVVRQAVALVAEEDAFHPVREYLNGLRWDRKPRLGTWLAYYAGCEPDENLSAEEKEGQRQYISAIGRMFLISMVARVMRPGCKVDYMLILEGKQGARKSTVGEILGGEWFSDSLPDIGSDAVRLSQHLRGKWLIEIGELSAMSKTETGALKDFLVRKEEKFTPKYGHMDVVEPRQCVFFGTTNKSTYLRDETGARRFWPVEAGTIDVIALAEDRDQLLAEAVNAYRGGEQWWPDSDFEKQFIQPQQEARHEADAWEQAIGEWLATNPDNVTILKVARLGLSIETPRLGTADQRRISAALERLGWQRGSVVNGVQKWIQKGLNQ